MRKAYLLSKPKHENTHASFEMANYLEKLQRIVYSFRFVSVSLYGPF